MRVSRAGTSEPHVCRQKPPDKKGGGGARFWQRKRDGGQGGVGEGTVEVPQVPRMKERRGLAGVGKPQKTVHITISLLFEREGG